VTDALGDDRRYCREILPRVSRTFAINIRVLSGTLGESVRVGYLLCRAADTLEDAWSGPGLEGRFDRFLLALGGDPEASRARAREAAELEAQGVEPRDEIGLLARLARVLRVYAALPPAHRDALREGVSTLARGMSRYALRATRRGADLPYLDDEAELDDYCWIVAGCVGVMLTRLYGVTHGVERDPRQARRLELAPLVGRALQLTNILLDWPVDLRRGRCYVPATWLAEHGLTPRELVERERPEVRALSARLESKALEALSRVPDYLDLIPARHVRYRLFCLWPAVWAVRSIRHARRDREFPWGPRRPKLPRQEIVGTTLRSILTAGLVPDLRGELRMFSTVVGQTSRC
jgi:farnesyl-diphosphate farnesyltransferase